MTNIPFVCYNFGQELWGGLVVAFQSLRISVGIKNKILPFCLFVSLLGLSLFAFSDQSQRCQFVLASFNAEELLAHPPMDKAKRSAFHRKIENVGNVIKTINNGQGPDFIGLQEVGASGVLEALLDSYALSEVDLPHFGTSGHSQKGANIDIGFLSRFPVIRTRVHDYADSKSVLWNPHGIQIEGPMTRPIFEVALQLPNNRILTVFIVHFPSRIGDADKQSWALARRLAAVQILDRKIKKILFRDPDALVAAIGDFNAEPMDVELRSGLGAVRPEDGSYKEPGHLYNLAFVELETGSPLEKFKISNQEKYGTIFYKPRNQWQNFDQILVSKAMLKYFVRGTYRPVARGDFLDAQGHPESFHPTLAPNGASNHRAINATFVIDGVTESARQKNY